MSLFRCLPVAERFGMILITINKTSKSSNMKKIFIAAVFLLIIAMQGFGQQGWAIGDKAMIGHSWMVGNRASDDLKYAFHPSVQFGRSAIYNFNSKVGVGLGTFFSTEGGTFKIDNNTAAEKTVQRMNYIRVPLGAVFTLGSAANRVRPRVGIGGSVGFLVGGKTYILSDEDAFAGTKTKKAMSTKVDAGATALLGYSVRVAEGFFINHDINYYHGLVENKYESNLPSFTHRGLGLSLGFSLTGDAMRNWKNKRMNHR